MYGMVRKVVPEMYAFTVCMWLKPTDGGIGTPFSYAVPEQPNELVLLQGVHNPVELLINDKVRVARALRNRRLSISGERCTAILCLCLKEEPILKNQKTFYVTFTSLNNQCSSKNVYCRNSPNNL